MPHKKKATLHPRNKHHHRYDLDVLAKICPELKPHITTNPQGEKTINFFDPLAVKLLNKALLKQDYGLEFWDIPDGYLCPPIPGRADYIHHVADLLAKSNKGVIPKGAQVRVLDIGVGANCVYPVIGHREYGWSFVGTDTDEQALASAQEIIQRNDFPEGSITLRHQPHQSRIFRGIVRGGEKFHLSICNPPFHASLAEANRATTRKLKNLKKNKKPDLVHNFSGQSGELWYDGGEIAFVEAIIQESRHYPYMFRWFTTLISKQSNLRKVYKLLKTVKAKEIITREMAQGNKQSRIVCWRY
ncbi:MAG TPA: 23S rRNA (adenine(1618)-N(6))-methyltransferase RlmF [Saprospiraceae bacterium]|nr:23S rRNA (adenine(1618)-N(6))-methyltransferase RlmF [Saprospiraceae bacterium]